MRNVARFLVAVCLTSYFGISSAVAGVLPSDVQIVQAAGVELNPADIAFAAIGLFDGNDQQQNGQTGLAILNGVEGDVFDSALSNGALWAFVGSTNPGTVINGDVNQTSGFLNLTPPVSGSFVISLKSSNRFAFYLFTEADNASRLAFTMRAFENPNGNSFQQLSHAGLYVPTGGTPPGIGGEVPEPGALAVFGLLALTCTRVRSRRIS